jgi:hypothetical protein
MFVDYKQLQEFIINITNELSEKINRQLMLIRMLMGKYWISLYI